MAFRARTKQPRDLGAWPFLKNPSPLNCSTIAHRLGPSARTIEMHRRNAFAKLGLKSIAETVVFVTNAGSRTSSGAVTG